MLRDYVSILRNFNRDVRLYLFTTALLGFTVFGGIYPVLFNLYLLRMGYGPEFVGLVNSVGGLAFAVFSLPAGILSRRWGGRRTMLAGLGTAVFMFAILPLAEFVPAGMRSGWLLACVFVRAIGYALYWVNARPFLASATRERERSHVYSIQSALWPLSGFAGSLIAGLMPGLFAAALNLPLDHPAPYRYPLWVVAVVLLPGLVAIGSIRVFSLDQEREQVGQPGRAPFATIALLSVCILLQATGHSVAMAFMNVYLDDGLQVSTASIGTISAVTQLLSAMAALSTPVLAKRWGSGRVFYLGSVGIALCLLPLAFVPHWSAAALGFLGITILNGIAFPAINVYQMQVVSSGWRTAMSGATAMASGLSYSAASFFGGQAIAGWGYRPLFVSGATLTFAGALLFGVCFGGSGKRSAVKEEGGDRSA